MPKTELLTFVVNHVSTVACAVLFFLTCRRGTGVGTKLKALFLLLLGLMFLLNLGTLLQTYGLVVYGKYYFPFILVSYVGICCFPAAILELGLAFRSPHTRFKPYTLALLVFPLISLTFICVPFLRDNYFFLRYSTYSDEAVYGLFYYVHSAYSYIFILVGIINIVYFSIKNVGFFSTQSLIISAGIFVAVVSNVLYSFNFVRLTFDITACSLAVATICFSVAILKYKFLSVMPIALKKVVDIISDGFIVVDNEYRIIDYNNAIFRLFQDDLHLEHNDDIRDLIGTFRGKYIRVDEFEELYSEVCRTGQTLNVEKHFKGLHYDKYFNIEISPVFTEGRVIGVILLFKDITRERRDLDLIRETMNVMLEKERLATLGQMVGGIAHNLKTPIMSISGGLEAVNDLIEEYDNSVGNPTVTADDHREIAEDMREWIVKIRQHCAYISDMISAIKGQAVHLNADTSDSAFTIDEFIKRLDLLMKHELKKHHCTLNRHIAIDPMAKISGEINSLVQIFDNLIANSIYAYNGKEGEIDLIVKSSGDDIKFFLTDRACGMPNEVKNRLFREMVTTKGKNGTGLGLYMSYANIKGHFKGNMEVVSELGVGTTFAVTIPRMAEASKQLP